MGKVLIISAKKYLDGMPENVNKLDARATDLIAAYEAVTQEQLKLKAEDKEVFVTHPPIHRRLHQPRIHLLETQVANEVWIWH